MPIHVVLPRVKEFLWVPMIISTKYAIFSSISFEDTGDFFVDSDWYFVRKLSGNPTFQLRGRGGPVQEASLFWKKFFKHVQKG